MSELKPCPFCKEAKELNTIPQHGEWFAGWCSRCDAVGPLALTKELAIAAWNTRADPKPRPWLRAEEVTEPGWYWFQNHLRFITAVQRSVDGELYANDRGLLFQPIKEIGDENARWQRIPKPELPGEEGK